MNMQSVEKVTLGGGCFWCTEAIFRELKGVVSVVPGYSGGYTANPTYQEVCSGTTGHAEVVQVTFDPAVTGFFDILEVFFTTHDPTTLNRQGADIGSQYRSVIFYHSDKQKEIAKEVINNLMKEKIYSKPVVTEITRLDTFYPAEDYHRDYFSGNKNQPYCQFVIAPKLEKFRKVFRDRVKSDAGSPESYRDRE